MHILITGASSGIGKELALLLNRAGHQLSLCGRSSDKLAATLDLLQRECGDKSTVHTSQAFCISHFDEISRFCQGAIDTFGPVDVLINCAGLNSSRKPAESITKEELDWMMTVNCYAPIQFIQDTLNPMKEKSQGMIINVLSTTCLYSNPGISGYTTSKAAFDAYSKVLRKELLQENSGVKVCSVYPGGVDTDFRDASRPNYLSAKDVAQSIATLIAMPQAVHTHELVIRPECELNL